MFVLQSLALMDHILERLLTMKMPNLSKDLRKSLFENPTAPLKSFYAKIELAYALAIIDKSMHRDLNTMRQIRNEFAHPKVKDVHLDTPAMLKLPKKFEDYKDYNGKMVRLFYWQAKTNECLNDLQDIEKALLAATREKSS
jgi:hypothetical protein